MLGVLVVLDVLDVQRGGRHTESVGGHRGWRDYVHSDAQQQHPLEAIQSKIKIRNTFQSKTLDFQSKIKI